MTDIIAGCEAVAAVDEALAELRDREQAYRERVAVQADEHQAALADREEQAARAREAGEPTPPRPVQPISDRDHNEQLAYYANMHEQLMTQRRRAVAASITEITTAARAQVDAAVDDTPMHVEALRQAALQVQRAREAVAQAHLARDETSGQRREYPDTPYDAHNLIDLIDRGGDPLTDAARPRKLGMTTIAMPDTSTSEPTAEEKRHARAREAHAAHGQVRWVR